MRVANDALRRESSRRLFHLAFAQKTWLNVAPAMPRVVVSSRNGGVSARPARALVLAISAAAADPCTQHVFNTGVRCERVWRGVTRRSRDSTKTKSCCLRVLQTRSVRCPAARRGPS